MRTELAYGETTPEPIHVEREQMVEQIVSRRDRREHPPDALSVSFPGVTASAFPPFALHPFSHEK